MSRQPIHRRLFKAAFDREEETETTLRHNAIAMEATAHYYDNDNSSADDHTATTWKTRAAVTLLGLFGVGSLRRTRLNSIGYDDDSSASGSGNESQDDGDGLASVSRQPLVGARRDRRADKTARRIERNGRALRDCGLD